MGREKFPGDAGEGSEQAPGAEDAMDMQGGR